MNKLERTIRNTRKLLKAYQQAARITTGKEREKYLSAVDNYQRYLLVLTSKPRPWLKDVLADAVKAKQAWPAWAKGGEA